jgi:MoxR-like ATPase
MEQTALKDEIFTLTGIFREIRGRIGDLIVGNEDLIELGVIALLSGGHILIEGLPGTAKTTVVKTLALLSESSFSRFQCAVDSQPADIIGVRIFDQASREFILKKGPVFTNFLLIDEINRLSPKTQGAFIEAMSEHQATIDGETHPLPSPFIVFATQNPFEFEGTFPLIEAEKDRFMFSIVLGHMDGDGELEVIRREQNGTLNWDDYQEHLSPVISNEVISHYSGLLKKVHMEETLMTYIRDIVLATRRHGDIRLGASSRASIAFVRGSKVRAALDGRNYVVPDDVKWLAEKVLSHRIVLEKEAQISGITAEQVIRGILETTGVP